MHISPGSPHTGFETTNKTQEKERSSKPPIIYFNPAFDTLYVGQATWQHDLTTFLTFLPVNEACKIEALAIPSSMAEKHDITCINELPALRELIYVTPAPHQFCILMRYRDLWFEDALPASSGVVRSDKDGVAKRAKRKELWRLCEKETLSGGDGEGLFWGNYAEIFWMRLVGKVVGEVHAEVEEAWMPPGTCEYCRAHRKDRAGVLEEAGSVAIE